MCNHCSKAINNSWITNWTWSIPIVPNLFCCTSKIKFGFALWTHWDQKHQNNRPLLRCHRFEHEEQYVSHRPYNQQHVNQFYVLFGLVMRWQPILVNLSQLVRHYPKVQRFTVQHFLGYFNNSLECNPCKLEQLWDHRYRSILEPILHPSEKFNSKRSEMLSFRLTLLSDWQQFVLLNQQCYASKFVFPNNFPLFQVHSNDRSILHRTTK